LAPAFAGEQLARVQSAFATERMHSPQVYRSERRGELRSITMADERDEDQRSKIDKEAQQIAGQQGQSSEYGQQGPESSSNPRQGIDRQGREGSFGEESAGQAPDTNSGDGMSGQPIGGNDSNTGSGTTLTAGYTPPRADGRGGFIGSQADDSDPDFAREDRGALEEKEEESGGSSA
jgi:hypothetical protein